MAPVSVSTYAPPTATATGVSHFSPGGNSAAVYFPTPTPTSISLVQPGDSETDLGHDDHTQIDRQSIPTISVTESSANVIDPYNPWPTQDASAR